MALLLRNRTDGRVEQVVDSSTINTNVLFWILYGVEGIILIVTNFPIVFAVFFYAKLRLQKEFVLVAALALADGANGLGFLLASIRRILLVQEGNAFVLVTRWHCFLTPWVNLWTWSEPLAGLMLSVISIDRLVAVSVPIIYYNLTNRYAYAIVSCAYGYVFVPFLYTAYQSFQFVVPDVPACCYTYHGMTAAAYSYFQSFIIASTSASVLFYIPVLIKLKLTLDSNHAIDDTAKFHRLKTATTTLAISTFFTFTFYIVPLAISTTDLVNNKTILFLIPNVNAMVHIFIYIARFKDIRAGLKSLIKCSLTLKVGATVKRNRIVP